MQQKDENSVRELVSSSYSKCNRVFVHKYKTCRMFGHWRRCNVTWARL